MNKLIFAIFTILIVGCLAQTTLLSNWVIETNTSDAVVFSSAKFNSQNPKGPITVKVSTSSTDPLYLCFQPVGLTLQSDVKACNPSNLLTFEFEDDEEQEVRENGVYAEARSFYLHKQRSLKTENVGDEPKTYTLDIVIQPNTDFYLLAEWEQTDEEDYVNATITVVASSLCDKNEIWIGGDNCDKPKNVGDDEVKTGEIAVNETKTFSLTVAANTANNYYTDLHVNVNCINATVLTVEVQIGNLPLGKGIGKVTRDQNNVNVSISNPLPGTYYVNVTYLLTQSKVSSSSVLRASADETVEYGVSYGTTSCSYSDNQKTCDFTFLPLNLSIPGEPQPGETNKSIEYNFYRIEEQSVFIVGVGLPDEDDVVPNVFVSLNQIPSNESYNLARTEAEPVAYFHAETTYDQDWYVAVQSNGESQEYWIWVGAYGYECAANCSSHGVCNVYTGVCACDSSYKNYLCSDKRLDTVWIVLIAIACAVVLAIAIGVPIACYLKNSKNNSYERV